MAGEGAELRQFLRDAFAFERGRLIVLTLLSAIGAAAQGAGLMLLIPLLAFLGVDGGGRASTTIARLLPFLASLEGAIVLYLSVVFASALLVRARTVATAKLRLEFIDSFRDRLHRALFGLEWNQFLRLRGADVQQTIMGEVARGGLAMEQLATVISAGLVVPAMLFVAVGLSRPMALATLALGGIVALGSIPLNRRSAALGREAGTVAIATNAALTDDIAGLRVIKSFSAEGTRTAAFLGKLGDMRQRQLDLVAAAATSTIVVRATGAGVGALCLIAAVRHFGMGLGDALVFMLAFARLVTAALRIQEEWRRLLQSAPGYARARRMLDEFVAAAEPVSAVPAPPFRDRLALEQVSFRYDGADRPALESFDAYFPKGKISAIVGPSGAGKSTLVDLLLGLLAPDSGTLSVDGVPLSGGARAAWRHNVGYVQQEPLLFHDTIRANLYLGKPDATDAELWEALEKAAIADVVRRLPAGLDTLPGDRGGRLSGGERQRLTIARALLRRPALLLLDEATSAIDAVGEAQILSAVQALGGSVTIILVAHRSSILQAADHVVLVERGRLVAQGPWSVVGGKAGRLMLQAECA